MAITGPFVHKNTGVDLIKKRSKDASDAQLLVPYTCGWGGTPMGRWPTIRRVIRSTCRGVCSKRLKDCRIFARPRYILILFTIRCISPGPGDRQRKKLHEKRGKAFKNYRKRLVRSTVIRDGAGSVGSDSFGAALK